MDKVEKSAILLEAGKNELEVVEFSIGNSFYGINVAKVREIIKADIDLVSVPDTHLSIAGVINLRGSIIPVIDLARHLKVEVAFNKKVNRIIIAEFNKLAIGLLVSSVSRIHRLSWKDVEQPSQMLQTEHGYAIGIVKVNDRVIFLLDFEKIASHINSKAHLHAPDPDDYRQPSSVDRAAKRILVVEDSDFIRKLIVEHLQQAGYHTDTANNGNIAWEKLAAIAGRPDFEKIDPYYSLMVTDIEMPQVDGFHLIKRVKQDMHLRRLPCIAFSSMISKEMILKCKSVGSDGEITKPEIQQLVALVDAKVL